jgi:hypothetical protein
MNILETILNAQGGGAVRQMGQQFGLSDDQTMSALSALVPALSAGFQRETQQSGGLESLAAALAGGRHQQYLDDPSTLGNAATRTDGDGILGHIFGSKDVSRQVAARAATQTGIDASILKQMLPLAAALMMGSMSQQRAQVGPGAGTDMGSGLMSMLTPMLDSNRDGSMIDDVMGMLGKFGR